MFPTYLISLSKVIALWKESYRQIWYPFNPSTLHRQADLHLYSEFKDSTQGI